MHTPTIPKNLDAASSKQLNQIILNASIFARCNGVATSIAATFSPTKVNLSKPILSANVKYDAANHKLIILVDGVYQVFGFIFYNNPSTTGVTYQALIYKNGSAAVAGFDVVSAATIGKSVTACDVLFLKKNDYIELYAQTGSSSTQPSGSTNSNYLYLYRV